MSYDNGREEDRRLVEEYADLCRNHEIACRTYLHPTIERCLIEKVARQILQDRMELEI